MRAMNQVMACFVLCGCAVAGVQAASTARQQQVAEKGDMVMPFNVHNSTHVFLKTPEGGTQQVIAKDAADHDLVAAIRQHLVMEAARFGQGDYSDPMKIHGMDMPGVQYLVQVKPGQIGIVYRDARFSEEARVETKKSGSTLAVVALARNRPPGEVNWAVLVCSMGATGVPGGQGVIEATSNAGVLGSSWQWR